VADSKLIISWFIGPRDSYTAKLIGDLASRLIGRIQLTSDGLRDYLEAVEGAFGKDIDYTQLQKIYDPSTEQEKRYSPAQRIGIQERVIKGNPDP
jgi:hypothetical protein